jgi:hypothetical protein
MDNHVIIPVTTKEPFSQVSSAANYWTPQDRIRFEEKYHRPPTEADVRNGVRDGFTTGNPLYPTYENSAGVISDVTMSQQAEAAAKSAEDGPQELEEPEGYREAMERETYDEETSRNADQIFEAAATTASFDLPDEMIDPYGAQMDTEPDPPPFDDDIFSSGEEVPDESFTASEESAAEAAAGDDADEINDEADKVCDSDAAQPLHEMSDMDWQALVPENVIEDDPAAQTNTEESSEFEEEEMSLDDLLLNGGGEIPDEEDDD